MDQPTAEEALKRLEPLVGEWILEAKPPDGPPWPGEARATIEWHDSGAHLVQHSTVDMPEAPDSISNMGCDAANGTYFQLYSDERGVCRVYEMIIKEGEWKLWREGEPFAQRFHATISDDGETIVGRWEKAPDGRTWETDCQVSGCLAPKRSTAKAGAHLSKSSAPGAPALVTDRGYVVFCELAIAEVRLRRIYLPGTRVNRRAHAHSFSPKNMATTTPERKVITPTEPMAHESPKVSAMIPAQSAPTA
jgi:hypothetical protein